MSMKITKLWKSVLVFSMCTTLGACQNKSEKNIKDGTYTAEVEGYQSSLTVKVTFSNGSITSVEVVDSNETKTWADSALHYIPKYIHDEQSLNVDTITGATVTSNAIISAVEKTIKDAHGDVSEWKVNEKVEHKQKEVEKNCDVVVAGGGLSGMVTTLRLQQLGYQCVLVEKSDRLGGITKYGGNYSQLYVDEDATFTNTNDLIQDNLLDTVTWQKKDLGVQFSDEYLSSSQYDTDVLKEYAPENSNIGELLEKETEVSGAEVLLNTCVTGLKKDGENVNGVSAIDSDGKIYHIQSKYVVIASGSAIEDSSEAVNPYNEGDLYTIFKNDEYQVSRIEPMVSNLCVSLSDQYIDTYYADQKMKEKEILLVDQDGKWIDLAQSREDLSSALKGDSYLMMNASVYKKWKAAILESGTFDSEHIKQLEEDENECFSSAEDLQTLCNMNGISYEGVVDSIAQHNMVMREEQSFDGDVYCVKLCRGTVDVTGGICVDASLHPVKTASDTSLDSVYVIGSAVDYLNTQEGISNTWAFVSGKWIADDIDEKMK